VIVLQRNAATDALIGRILSAHLTVGLKMSTGFSEILNQSISARVARAVEYNFFKWTEATRCQLTALYTLGGNHYRYYNTTVYGKDRETRLNQSLLLAVASRQTWRQQLQTSFRNNVFGGIGYTFGSIYNTIVNQRFGTLGESGRRFGFGPG